jgi:diguanylate cyclase (GGDEF)-like protein
MTERVSTSYSALLRRICGERLVDEAEVARLRRVLERAAPEAVAHTAHELLRQMVSRGELQLIAGRLDRPGTALRVADPRRGHLIVLPDLVDGDHPALRTPLAPDLGPPPSFSSGKIAELFHAQSRQTLSSVENSADVKGVLTGILNLTRELLTAPAALCFTRGLAAPNAIASGLRQLSPPDEGGDETGFEPLPEAWEPWVAAANAQPEELLYLPDLTLAPEDRRPIREGSALLVPLHDPHTPWEALLVAASREPFAFDQERLSRTRMFAMHFRRQLSYAVHLQTVISHDVLTGAYNRSFFEDQLTRVMAGAARKEQTFALLILDIDDFKLFNSQYGYDAGDCVLRGVAGTLQRALRSTDVLARYGGEEFAIILAPPVSQTEARQISARLHTAVGRTTLEVPTLTGEQTRVAVTVSVGGAIFPHHGSERDALWGEANRMLLAAKSAGKNRVHFPAADDETGRLRVL